MKRLSRDAALVSLVSFVGKNVVDVGCGTGDMCGFMRTKTTALSVTGVDPKQVSLSSALQKWPGVAFRLGSAQSIPLPNESVDVCTFFNSLHHSGDVHAVFQEMHRVLKPSGIIYVHESRAEGRLTPVVRQIEDCSALKATTFAGLDVELASGTLFKCIRQEDFFQPIAFPNYEAFETYFKNVDPDFEKPLVEKKELIQQLFFANATLTEGLYAFDHPITAFILEKISS
ncbi:class I SAM-dependent methyltransferase [Pelomyxa schiedti]|nr:class I SAM-dependent methyltransferase [Pelomyxa schiedti]